MLGINFVNKEEKALFWFAFAAKQLLKVIFFMGIAYFKGDEFILSLQNNLNEVKLNINPTIFAGILFTVIYLFFTALASIVRFIFIIKNRGEKFGDKYRSFLTNSTVFILIISGSLFILSNYLSYGMLFGIVTLSLLGILSSFDSSIQSLKDKAFTIS